MKAGRELDALIAEKVMGLSAIPHYLEGGEFIYADKDYGERVITNNQALPRYSTQIADAWLVVVHFKNKQCPVWLEGEDAHAWSRCDFKIWSPFNDPLTTDPIGHGWDESTDLNERVASASLAICLAALKAIE